jgi:translation initiation factor IF-2
MAEDKSMRLSQVAKVLKVGIPTLVSNLSAKGFKVDTNPNAKIPFSQLEILAKDHKNTELLSGFGAPRHAEPATAVATPTAPVRSRSQEDDYLPTHFRDDANRPKPEVPTPVVQPAPKPAEMVERASLPGLKVLGTIDLNKPKSAPAPAAPVAAPVVAQPPVAKAPVSEPKPVVAEMPAPVAPPAATKPAETPKAVEAPKVVEALKVADVPKASETPKPVAVARPEPVAPKPEAPKAAPVIVAEAPKIETSKPAVPQPESAPVAKAATSPPTQPAAAKPATPPPAPAPEASAAVAPDSSVSQPSKPNDRPKATEPAQAAPESPRPVAEKPTPAQPEPAAQPAAEVSAGAEVSGGSADEAETIRAAGSHQLGGLKILGSVDLTSLGNNRQGGGGGNNNNNNRDRNGKRPRVPVRDGNAPAQNRPASAGQGGQNRPAGQPGGQAGPAQNRSSDRPAQGGGAGRPGGGESRSSQPQGIKTDVNGVRTRADGTPINRAPGGGAGTQGRSGGNDRPVNRNATGGTTTAPGQTGGTGTAGAGGGTGGGGRPGGGRGGAGNRAGGNRRGGGVGDRRTEPTREEVAKNIRDTNDRLRGNSPNRGADRRRDRRQERDERRKEAAELAEGDANLLKVTEFVSANDLASLMDVSVNEVIATCMSLGMFVSINQRLDAEAITVIADEFGYDIEFVTAEAEVESSVDMTVDSPEDLVDRAPIVTIMGHVDHGKTSLLDYIRRTKVAAGEAGGITQHIGAYNVTTADSRQITFLDTPGHEAFTAMRARGAKVTDVVIIVIAADDSIMPQTREAINHAQVANVPIVFAFSKVDKAGADTEKIRSELSQMNILVEDWGGKYQSQEISSKSGLGIDDLLEKVLLESDILELKANPDRRAVGTVIEASLDKGRGYVTTVLVETGTLKVGEIMLVGAHFGRVRAMTNDRGERIKSAGPSTPVQILGLPGAPQAGDKFNIMETEREAREIANKREQLLREQSIRTRKHITLEEIGRRKAVGTFKELNIIVKGDFDGSVEALSDSLLQLSTGEVQVNIIHKAVGQISESDILLASASDAIVIGFQVRPSVNARKLAEQEQIEIRLYSIIYDAIGEIKDAMTGMLAPTVEEIVTGNIQVREVFKISKIGTVAGCYVTDGTVKRNNKIRVIRDFIVIHTGEIDALKRFKDDVSEVKFGYECGLSIKNFNDIMMDDVIESFELKEVKRTL